VVYEIDDRDIGHQGAAALPGRRSASAVLSQIARSIFNPR
jgi:hypothetical protein